MKRIILFTAALTCVATTKAQEVTDTLKQQHLEEVIVAGVRRELPFLLAQTPGVLAWGENGLGTGTAAMRIRGAAGSRINITLDGVALNSPEDQTVFWANMNSYASLMGSVQIQRGIGTSTNGDGAFGGSVSLATSSPMRTPSAEVSASYGSYNTYNAGMKFSTGHLIFDGAYHETATDGYVHGTSGRSGSYYGGLTWLGDNFRISYKNIGNFEKTGQAWHGVVAGSGDLSLMDGTFGVHTGIKTYKDLYDRGLGKFNSLYEYLQTDNNGAFVKDAAGNLRCAMVRFGRRLPITSIRITTSFLSSFILHSIGAIT